ncbi:hypothetical protein EWB00_000638 [Schistosoma japonicum]|uniref:Uncharacterized protein n=1 Tax=Schistosoma japonicum TaxID=6182 RepID=A0A4Z2DJ16_SCHJA|nr:hypothetical protein EWB00_000638 [Schistosoma japonicum]
MINNRHQSGGIMSSSQTLVKISVSLIVKVGLPPSKTSKDNPSGPAALPRLRLAIAFSTLTRVGGPKSTSHSGCREIIGCSRAANDQLNCSLKSSAYRFKRLNRLDKRPISFGNCLTNA